MSNVPTKRGSPGRNAQPEFEIRDGVLTKCKGVGAELAVPEGVIEIGKRAFAGCAGATSLSIPVSVKILPAKALGTCSRVKNITMSRELAATILYQHHYGGCCGSDFCMGEHARILELLAKIAYPFTVCVVCGSGKGFTAFRGTCKDCGNKQPFPLQNRLPVPDLLCQKCGESIPVGAAGERHYYPDPKAKYTCSKCKK